MNPALLSFSLGPVQDFIAAARTTRDLWTGSWLLSWLTAQAIHEVLEIGNDARLLFPSVWTNPAQRVPLLAAIAAIKQGRQHDIPSGALMACLPNTFVASVPHNQAEAVGKSCRDVVVAEWQRIAGDAERTLRLQASVHGALAEVWREHSGWDARWPDQIAEFWDIRTVVLPGDVPDYRLRRLFDDPPTDPFQLRLQSLAKLAAAQKQIRHFPPHELGEYACDQGVARSSEPRDDTRPKCSLLGSLAQMGPIASGKQSQMAIMGQFWSSVGGTNLVGTRLGQRDRLCAVSLVKRFAWPAVLANELNQDRDARQFPDIDTICAAVWLTLAKTHAGLDAEKTRSDDGREFWSGHWLRWTRRDEGRSVDVDDPEPCPDEATWRCILAAKAHREVGPPPTYHAVIQLDGDKLGELLGKLDKKGLEIVSRELATFAGETVPGVVKAHRGSLVYAGGDDVLAFVPARQSLACANQLNAAFRALNFPHASPKCSAAVVVAHYKTPLRIVLAAAREAEQAAKRAGRDCLAVRVMKRSGEQATAVVGWELVEKVGTDESSVLEQFVEDFRGGATDRWTYRFRQELDNLSIPAMWPAELTRLLGRAESLPQGFADRVLAFWSGYQDWSEKRMAPEARERPPTWPRSFVHLMQAASFLARGGKE